MFVRDVRRAAHAPRTTYTAYVIPRASRMSLVVALTLLALLVVLGTLQYRWLSQIGEAERERTLARMQSAASRFAMDFDRELTRAFAAFVPRPPRGWDDLVMAQRFARWEQEALVPDLVRSVFLARSTDGRRFALSLLDRETGQLAATAWPADLHDLRDRLEHAHDPASRPPGLLRPGRPVILAADVPALVARLPLPPPETTEPRGFGSPLFGLAPPAIAERGFIVIWLDRGSIQAKLLPELTTRHFGGPRGVEYHVLVTMTDDPQRVVFSTGPQPRDGAPSQTQAVAELFSLAPPDAGRSVDLLPIPPTRPQWRLLVADPAGTLEAAIAQTQRRNLAIVFGVLLLLALTMAMMLVTTHRSRRLAQQQFEFVTGVTHELRTPLAAMRAAAQNLVDGVVRDPGRMMRYSVLIDREARRLTDMVDQILEFAGLRSGHITFDHEPVSIEKVIEEALAEVQPSLQEKAIRVDTEYAQLPTMIGDARALRRAVVNLLTNAIKYGAAGGWIGVRACSIPGVPARIQVTVEDRGVGIAAVDLPHVFEAFYRGRGRSASSVPGSGLGLTIVRKIAEAHGGRITVGTRQPSGAAFTLEFPAAS